MKARKKLVREKVNKALWEGLDISAQLPPLRTRDDPPFKGCLVLRCERHPEFDGQHNPDDGCDYCQRLYNLIGPKL